jgi:methionyl-tRNA formyltransferase
LDGKTIKIIAAEAVAGSGEPGALHVKDGSMLDVGCGGGMLRIVSLQPEGKKAMSAAEFLRGHRIEGKKFDIRKSF